MLVRRVIGCALAAGTLAGCPARDREKAPRPPEEPIECRVRLPDVAWSPPPPEPFAPPRSRLGVEVEADLAALERALARQVPVTLAAERRKPVGTPGEVSYVVRRGRFGIRVEDERLAVTVPVEVEAEVCKPLGPFCPTYARCSPRLAAVASVPLLLDETYAVGKSRVSIAVTRPCILAGLDATPQIRKQAQRQVGAVQRRIDASMPEIRPSVASVWELLHHPVALGATTCLRIDPDRITQQKPRLEHGKLVTELGAEGRLSIQDPCERVEVRAPPLPPLVTRDGDPSGIDLRVPVATSWLDVSAELTRSLAGLHGTTRVVKLEAAGTRAGVALRATLAGATCGELHLLAEPWFDAATGRVRLRRVAPVPGVPPFPDLAHVLRSLERQASAALPVDIASGPAALAALVQGFGKDLPERVDLESELERPTVERVHPASEGLVVLAIFSGRATFRVR